MLYLYQNKEAISLLEQCSMRLMLLLNGTSLIFHPIIHLKTLTGNH